MPTSARFNTDGTILRRLRSCDKLKAGIFRRDKVGVDITLETLGEDVVQVMKNGVAWPSLVPDSTGRTVGNWVSLFRPDNPVISVSSIN